MRMVEVIHILQERGFIFCNDLTNPPNIGVNDRFLITMKGRNYLEVRDRYVRMFIMEHRISVTAIVLSILAFIKSFFPDIITIWKMLQ